MAFEPYTAPHWAALGLMAALIAGICLWRRKLRGARRVRLGLAAAAAVVETTMLAERAVTGEWDVYALPFELCSLMIWLTAIMMLTGSRRLYEVTFFLGILGAVQALATPDLAAPFPTLGFAHFFIGHILIVVSNLYMTIVEGYRPTLRSALRAFGWLQLLAVPAAIADALAGTNFMFLARKPPTASLLDLLGPWPWYLLQLEGVALALCLLLLALVKLADRLLAGNSPHPKEASST
ncbi:YwaF family protein [Cohnella sp. 56]|uniref:YwaF family protein n=1 Tax=Cohnella sp. 56 TaxID=3113722 RepID=UPI0030E9C6CE